MSGNGPSNPHHLQPDANPNPKEQKIMYIRSAISTLENTRQELHWLLAKSNKGRVSVKAVHRTLNALQKATTALTALVG